MKFVESHFNEMKKIGVYSMNILLKTKKILEEL